MSKRTVAAALILMVGLAMLAIPVQAKATKQTTDTLTYTITYKGDGVMNVMVNQSTANVEITNGALNDMLDIKLQKKAAVSRPIDSVVTDGSFKKLSSQAPLGTVAAPNGQIKSLSTKNVGVQNVSAKEIGNVSVFSSLPQSGMTSIVSAGGQLGKAQLKPNIKLVGAYLADLDVSTGTAQVVNKIQVQSKKFKDAQKNDYVASAGIGNTTDTATVKAGELKNVKAVGAAINASEVMAKGGKNAKIMGIGQAITGKVSGQKFVAARPGDIAIGSLLSGANNLMVDAKGGSVDGDAFVSAYGISKVSSKIKTYKDSSGQKQTMGGLVGDATEAPTSGSAVIADAPYFWEGQLYIVSGGVETPYTETPYGPVASPKPPKTDINQIHGDLGVYMGAFADVETSGTQTGWQTIDGSKASVKKISVHPKLGGKVQGFAYTATTPKSASKKLPFDPNFFVSGAADPLK